MYSEKIANSIREYLDSREYDYVFNKDLARFMLYACSYQKIRIYPVYIYIAKVMAETRVVFPIGADEDKRSDAAEFISRANHGLVFGCFSMNYDDGEILFKMRTCRWNEELSEEEVRRVIEIPMEMACLFGDALLSVLCGLDSPAEAVRKAKSNIKIINRAGDSGGDQFVFEEEKPSIDFSCL